MNVFELSQIVNHPDEATDEFLELMRRAADRTPDPYIGVWLGMKLHAGALLHPLGLHTWVRWMTYDQPSDRVIDTGGMVCAYCSVAKRVRN